MNTMYSNMKEKDLIQSMFSFCKMYGENNPAEKKKEFNYADYISENIKSKNEEIVKLIIKYLLGNPKKYGPNTFPVIFFNGNKVYEDYKTRTIKKEIFTSIPFAEGRPFPLINTSNKLAYDLESVLPEEYYIDCWDYGKYMICYDGDNISQEEMNDFDNGLRKYRAIYMHTGRNDIPEILKRIQEMWSELCRRVGDEGFCTIGEGMVFYYNGQKYKMPPYSPYQGCDSWKRHVAVIKEFLTAIGAEEIHMDYGRID